MRFRFLSLFTLIILFGVACTGKVLAVSPDSILVNMAPENPAPNENVSINLSSYVSNLDSVSISWSVDGKVLSSGVGDKSFSVTAPAAGGETNVVASISLPDGRIDRSMVIRSSAMVLLWQADDSYVPPFYKGKAMPTPSSEVKVVAMPEVKSGSEMVSPTSMVYAWQQDYSNDQGASGYGKNFYVYTNDYLQNSNNISVNASTTDQKFSADASIDIGTFQPKILFYKNDAALGTLWEQALYDGYKVANTAILQAAPYFISPENLQSPTLSWSWSINDTFISVAGFRQYILPLKVQAGTSGTSNIKLEVDNDNKIFETANGSVNVQF